MHRIRIAACLLVAMATSQMTQAQIVNGSFETGDFTGWIATDMPGPYSAISVLSSGTLPVFNMVFGCPLLSTASTDGAFSVHHGFAGAGPGVYTLAQDVVLGPCSTRLEFDWVAAWEMTCCGATLPRTFRVDIEPVGGGAFLQRSVLLTAAPQTDVCSTGATTSSVDVSAFAGLPMRISFEWDVPELGTGPGFFELDNVRFTDPIANGSFETGDLTGWGTTAGPFVQQPWAVFPAGSGWGGSWFCSAPVHGNFSAGHGIMGATLEALFQDVCLGPCDTTITFEWRVAYLEVFGDDYEFRVEIEPSGGGVALQSDLITSVVPLGADTAGTMVTQSVDVSAFAGSCVRLSFEWALTAGGPFPINLGQFELDNVRVGCVPSTAVVRNGSGLNPTGFSELGGAEIGGSWDTRVVLPAGALGSTVQISTGGPFSGFFLSGLLNGELLMLPPFLPTDVVLGTDHAIPIPPDCTLAGATLAAQATTFSLGPLNFVLQNALDFTIGTQ